MATKQGDQPDTTDSVDFAMSLSRGSVEAKSLLEWQARLVETQETLAHADLRYRGWQIISERVGAILKGMTAVVGFLVLLAVAAFLWSASHAKGMVVDAFSVPPSMEQRGLTGTVVASELLDKTTALEMSTQSARAPSSYENSWADTDGVQVPYTGLSLGQLRREARAWLGSETHLKGDVVVLGSDRVAISFRAGKASGRVEGTNADFDKLLQAAALKVFEATQPYRYHVWLDRNGGTREQSDAVLRKLLRSSNRREQLWALHGLALNAPTQAEYIATYQRALKMQPDFLPAVGNMAWVTLDRGHEEAGLRLNREAAAAYRSGHFDYNRDNSSGFALATEATVAWLQGDMQRQADLARKSLEYGADAANNAFRPFQTAWAFAELHDWTEARNILAGAGMLDQARVRELEKSFGPLPSQAFLNSVATNDYPRQASELRARLDSFEHGLATDDPILTKSEWQGSIRDQRPLLAIALARSGSAADAATLVAPAPADHDASLRARALVAAYAGKRQQSDAWFAQAVARTPSLPRAHLMWAEALLLRGDTKRAAEQAELANRKGPRWAEPLKLWGDALLAQGNAKDAEAKYAAAAERAPRWGRLQMSWANALWRSGRPDDARAKLRAAAGLDLSAADRRRLQLMWTRARTRAALQS
jgi:Tfp pilus assembly protein PilF